jgi:Mrp family chromosome partitioning ATPase
VSKNFELLRRVGKETVLFGQPGEGVVSGNDVRTEPESIAPVRVPESIGTVLPAANGNGGSGHGTQPQEEAVRLVQRVFLLPDAHVPRTVVFSSVQGNGSSEICFRAGEALASQGAASVCLVDANLRTPSLHRLLGVPSFPGLVDVTAMSGPIKGYTMRIAGGNLWLLPSGSSAAAAHGLFASDRLRLRLAELREQFDYVLIDAPPVGSNSDAVVLGQMADGVILVVEANSTRRETARMAKEIFEGAKVNLLGAILNNRTFPIPESIYHKL